MFFWIFYFLFLTSKNLEKKKSMNGKVKWYHPRKGYGFITAEDGKDVFVHYTAIPDGIYLHEGDEVEFQVEEGDKGPKAVDIKKL